MRHFDIRRPDDSILPDIERAVDNLNKPKGSLGVLEDLAIRICLIQHTLRPRLNYPCHLLFGGDHGIQREGVSVTPREVTWQQMVNFTRGGGGVNMFCRQHGFSLRVIDVGVDHDFKGLPGIIDRKIARGTADFLHGAAMTEAEMNRAIDVGVEMVDRCACEGCNILCVGEMGAANTSASSVWMSLLGGLPLDDCIGRGSGIDNSMMRHKAEVLSQAVGRFAGTSDPDNPQYPELVISYFGGFEMVAAVGAMLRAAERGMIVMVDGFIMSACMLAAGMLYPQVRDYAVFGHCGDEAGHARLLSLMHARPLLSLGMRLGEGTGALCAYPIIDSAVRMLNEMNTFDTARITKYF